MKVPKASNPAATWSRQRRNDQLPRAPRPGRTLPPGRGDRALQIVLSDPEAWEKLSHDDHQLLGELAVPHGALFSWLDSQVHDHGPQPWPLLREALRNHEFEAFAVGQVEKVFADIENDPQELRQILALERERRNSEEMNELSARAPADPQAYERLRLLVEAQKNKSRA